LVPLALRRALRAVFLSPFRTLLVVMSVAVTWYVVAGPIAATRYPPMTDLPFHAAHTSILRHYWDPSWHFHEQFELQPVAVPYLLHYAVGALLMLFLPTIKAVKLATAIMLLLVPGGMAVLLHGMKRSPFGALLSLPLAYCTLTHWGFINFVAALGLFAMAVGFAMLVVERPTRARRVGLAITLVLLFFTHIFRFPMGVAAVIGTAIFLYPATRRFRPILWPLVPSLLLFAAWLVVRPKALQPEAMELHFDYARREEIWALLFSGFNDPSESELAKTCAQVGGFVAAASLFAIFAEDRWFHQTRRATRFTIGAALVPVACAVVFLGLFFTLPMQVGVWWYVYPREATAAAYIAVAIVPGLPRSAAVRAPLVTAIAIAAFGYGQFVARHYASFNRETEDFARIAQRLPKAPKLLYLVFDHSGSTRATTPFIHLPAYVQAEKGGFLSFNFVAWGAAPFSFRSLREPGAVVPPPVPLRWEWTPNIFNVEEHGWFFDWFLVRGQRSPDFLFAADAEIERVDHVGKWWLYRRIRGKKPRVP
jgi:hypothetical protein